MKKLKLFVIIISLFIVAGLSTSCENTGTHVKKVKDLPENVLYESDDGHHMDLGIAYEWDAFCYLPMFISGTPEYVLYYKELLDDTYHAKKLDPDEVQFFVDMYGISLTPDLNLWDRYGFWIVLGGIILLGFISQKFF